MLEFVLLNEINCQKSLRLFELDSRTAVNCVHEYNKDIYGKIYTNLS